MDSLIAYGKLDEAEQARLDARRKTRKRIAIIALSSVVLIVVVVAAVVGTSTGRSKNENSNGGIPISSLVKVICNITPYPDTCCTSLSPLVNSSHVTPQEVFRLSVQVAINELLRVSEKFSDPGGFKPVTDYKMSPAVLESCRELLSLSVDHLTNALSTGNLTFFEVVDDLKTWLSSAGTYQQTCIDGFEGGAEVETLKTTALEFLKNSTEFTSNCLAIISEFSKTSSSLKLRRRLMSVSNGEMPGWVSMKDRKLLQNPNLNIKADVVVAKDGFGNYTTISDALKAVPDKSKNRFVIYVKNGVYYENVRVEKTKWNVMMIGDGMEATIVSGSLNFIDGTPTFQSATFAVFGQGFIAQNMGFCNTAGPTKHQAVALMSTSDKSVFYRCRIDAYQDSLYTHSNRQFYRECNIYGTVDFIFGNSAVVIQNCNILPKRPMPGQQNTITAQGKKDPNQNTGISIHNCTIWPSENLTSVSTFLGRPWKNYSTTVFINSMMGDFIDPKGWLPWVGDSAPDTIFYAEFANFGPGSNTTNRVKWMGLRNITSKQASKFTVKSFIKGEKWISAAGVSCKPSL